MKRYKPVTIGRARPYLFMVAEYIKTRRFTSIKRLVKALGISHSQAGCCLTILGWKKHSPKSKTYHRG
ncbi:MAG: hypothetical protein ACW99G_21620 [Candidatus Thorarchaeota archaeon]|jgi:hypothetical protein